MPGYSQELCARQHSFEFSKLVSAYYFKSAPLKEAYHGNNSFSQIYLVLNGNGYFKIENSEYKISPGMMIYCPPDKEFTYGWDDDGHVEYALISFVCRSDAVKTFENGPIMLAEEEKKILLDTIRTTTHICDYSKVKQPPRIEIYIKQNTPEVVIDYIYASLERFFCLLYCRVLNIGIVINETQKINKTLQDSILISEVKDYLKDHVRENIKTDDICKYFGISKTVLMEKFRKETNKTVIEYFNELKVGLAMDMIRNSGNSFTEISEELGFSTLNYFSKLFKAKTGMTLTDFSRLTSKRSTSILTK